MLSQATERKPTVNVSDSRALRSILGSFATGVTIATTVDSALDPVGVTANSFSSVSMEPPLVSWCLKGNSYSLPAFRHSQSFAINVLGAADVELCRRFAQSHAHKWRDIIYKEGFNGCPLLAQAIATIECKLVAEHEAGDHVILIGQVERANAADAAQPLVFYRGRFYDLGDEETSSSK